MSKSRKICFEAFLEHNITGKRKESMSFGNYSFHGPVMYYSGNPTTRILHNGFDKYIVMCKYSVYFIPKWAEGNVRCVCTPDISVFSHYPGDWLEDPVDIHGRTKYILFCKVKETVQLAYTKDAAVFVNNPHFGHAYILGQLRSIKDTWRKYSKAFGLGWQDIPDLYENEINDVMARRKAAFLDPAAVERRARAKARSEAKKALGLAGGKK